MAARAGATKLAVPPQHWPSTMLTPFVTEIPRTLNAVAHDTFIDGAGDSGPRRPARSRPTATTTRAPAQADIAGRAGDPAVDAAPAASAATGFAALTRAA